MSDLEGVRWAYVTCSVRQRQRRSKAALSRLDNHFRRYGVAVHPHVFLMPVTSVCDLRASLSSRRRGPDDKPLDIFIHLVHPRSNESVAALVTETLLVDLRQALIDFEQLVTAAKKDGRWIEDVSGERVLAKLRGAKVVLRNLPHDPELLDCYGRLCRSWERYFSEVHAAVLAKLRPPVYRRRYRVAAGQWFAEQRTSPLPGFESFELNGKDNREPARDTSSASQDACDKTG